MALRIGNLSEKGFDQSPVISVSQFARIYPSRSNSNEPHPGQFLPKDGESQTKHLCIQLPEQESSSTQSTGHSSQEMSFTGGANSHHQSMSSESDVISGRSGRVENKPVFLFVGSEIAFNGSQADQTYPRVRVSYPPAIDPYFSSLLAANGLQILPHGSQGTGIASPRVPLPLTFAEDRLVFVNAKQYSGILRRRQSRAKLGAQNKLFRTRKPYQHESRHRHALNRIRGSGGRFLSTKKLKELNPLPGDLETESHGHRHASDFFCAKSDNGFSQARPSPA